MQYSLLKYSNIIKL
uniref:Uncharacterized protein n=1 Tax=Anguilla anguilla TaxID=7936 RepID=A0A0E9W076_ANGAN